MISSSKKQRPLWDVEVSNTVLHYTEIANSCLSVSESFSLKICWMDHSGTASSLFPAFAANWNASAP